MDVRPGSPTYGQWAGATLTAEAGEQLFVPRGFAHGYCTLKDDSEIAYKVDGLYAPQTEGGIIWNDPDIGIAWPFKGEVILGNPLIILWISIPLITHTVICFALGYGIAKLLGLSYESAAPSAMIGASSNFEVAIATAVMLFGLNSGAALVTVVGVLTEVPVMLMLVRFCVGTQHWFRREADSAESPLAQPSGS